MKKSGSTRVRRVLSSLVIVTIVTTVLASPAAAAVAVTTGGPFSYTEQDPPLVIGTGTSVSGGDFYDGQYVDFEIDGGTSEENLALQSVSTPVTTDGVVSVVGTAVYVGDGSTAVPIGSIDAVSDGQGGTKLRVNFGSDFRNAGFETGDVSPWTAVNTMVELGVTSIAGFVTSDTATYPSDSGGDGDAPASSSYNVATTSANPPDPTEGTYALGLTSSMTTANGCDVVHGPAAYSAPFDSAAGQTLTFDWRAYAGGDAYAVFGYLLNTSSGVQTEVLDAYTTNTSGTTNWATVNVTVPTTGTYRFVFVSGTYDASCGRVAGASLYVDNFQVVSSDLVDDAMVSSVAELLTYEHTGDDPAAVRTVSVTAQSVANGSASGDITVNITPVNDPPVGDPVFVSWENLPGDDTFEDLAGPFEFTDPDDSTLTWALVGGTPGTYSLSGTDYDYELVGTYGTAYLDAETGLGRLVANDAAIEAVTDPDSETFTISAFDGTDSGTTTLHLGILLPPAPRNVVGVAGDGEVTVEWDEPGETTGITGYVVTASPGGETCTTVGVNSTTCVVTGLTNGTAYTFTVTPTTGSGPGTTSLPSPPVTPTGPPGPPTAVVATPGDGRAVISWTPPVSDGGSAITGYTVSSSPGGGSCTTTTATNCTILGLAVGTTYTFTVHATNAEGDGPESDSVELTIKNISSTALATSDTEITVGDSVTLTATVTGSSPTGTVEFFDGTTSLGTVALSGGTAELATDALAAGVRSVTAVYGGDDDNTGSTSSATTITVKAIAAVTLSASPTAPTAGESVTLTAAVTGDSPTGTVEFFDGTTSLGTATVSGGSAQLVVAGFVTGGHTLSAVYSGDATNTEATSDDLSMTVRTAASVVVTASDTDVIVGDSVTLTATVTGSSPGGTVEFFDGTTSLGTVALSGGTAQLVTDTLPAGVRGITAVYSGDTSNTPDTSAELDITVRNVASVSLAVSDPSVIIGDEVTLTATITGDTPTGTVEFFDGTTSLGTATVSGGTAVLVTDGLGAGSHSLTAVYSGDSTNTPDTSDAVDLTVSPAAEGAVDDPDPAVGGQLVVRGDSFAPNSEVEIWLMGDTPVLLGTVTTDDSGAFTTTVTLPDGVAGAHNVELRGTDQAGDPTTIVLAVTIRPELAVTGLTTRSIVTASLLALVSGAMILMALALQRRPPLVF